ncbi:hypothetical protein [Rathayibacter sp. VKM Ac-2760]|uniref:hypothetical protein n=1 Tax=Rathayibacter sp. VKM Ac-2760 TaxID=2609253 RepID=UPI001319177D|nr:hypothetical protein [Rathayibacter sp. VKM Ac-2760]QHC58017.1 hypothetical protein GSU72_05150 [Rathayibacter sp. VKM Ac-2760]
MPGASRRLSLAILEVPFRVELGPGVSGEDVARIRSSWAACAAPETPDARVLRADVAGATTETEGVRVLASSVAQLEESLTSTLTLEAIGERRGDLLMLHACGIAADDGRVLAFVAASGTGKTTASRALGARFGYVTDETVAVTAEGRVLPYPKPLSVKPATVPAPKAQLSPRSLGLRPVPDAPLTLAAVVLLDRRDGVAEPRLEEVDPVDALDELVPQTSYLAARPRSLSSLVGALSATGGVRRLVYSEAEQVTGLIEGLFAAPAGVAPPIWAEVVPLPIEAEERIAEGAVLRAAVDDALLLPGGEIVVFRENTLIRLSGVGPSIWRAAGRGVDLPALVDAVLAELGTPPDGIDAASAVAVAVEELEGLGLIARATPPQPTPDGVQI